MGTAPSEQYSSYAAATPTNPMSPADLTAPESQSIDSPELPQKATIHAVTEPSQLPTGPTATTGPAVPFSPAAASPTESGSGSGLGPGAERPGVNGSTNAIVPFIGSAASGYGYGILTVWFAVSGLVLLLVDLVL